MLRQSPPNHDKDILNWTILVTFHAPYKLAIVLIASSGICLLVTTDHQCYQLRKVEQRPYTPTRDLQHIYKYQIFACHRTVHGGRIKCTKVISHDDVTYMSSAMPKDLLDNESRAPARAALRHKPSESFATAGSMAESRVPEPRLLPRLSQSSSKVGPPSSDCPLPAPLIFKWCQICKLEEKVSKVSAKLSLQATGSLT